MTWWNPSEAARALDFLALTLLFLVGHFRHLPEAHRFPARRAAVLANILLSGSLIVLCCTGPLNRAQALLFSLLAGVDITLLLRSAVLHRHAVVVKSLGDFEQVSALWVCLVVHAFWFLALPALGGR